MKVLNVLAWFDNKSAYKKIDNSDRVNISRCIPFLILHLSLFLFMFANCNIWLIGLCVFSYLIRMFAITGFYHRCFSHKTFEASLWVEVTFAFLGACSAQRGPIWWASHHRRHHISSDQELDEHSPVQNSFMYSHILWFMTNKNYHIPGGLCNDLLKKPYMVWIDRFDGIVPLFYIFFMWLVGFMCAKYTSIPINGFDAVYWGFCVSTILLLHATLAINSCAHMFGSKKYKTQDNSKNNWLLALITLGEGWHNNHHYYPNSCRQGFYFHQIDITYLILNIMKHLGLIKNIKNIPEVLK